MKLHHLKVSNRLGLGFGAVCALLALIVGIGWNGLGRLKAQTDSIVQQDSPRLSMVSEAAIHVLRIDVALRNFLLSDDDAQRADQMAIIKKETEQALGNLERLQSLTHFPEGQALVRRIMEQRARYLDGRRRLFELAGAGNPDQARAYLIQELRPVSEAYQAALGDMLALLTQRVQEAGQAADAAHASAHDLMLSLGAAALLAAVILGWLITRGILRQLGGEPVLAAGIAGRIAEGDLTVDIPVKEGDAESLMAAMRNMRDSLARLVGEVRGGSDAIASASAQITAGNLDLSSRTEQQASSLAETAATMEEITATVRQNADNVQQANILAESAAGTATQSGAIVGELVATMARINTQARQVAETVGVIDSIAFQTNILALNAAVEAARAGQQGRGFAVVAAEVRALAQRSADAAKEIKTLIEASSQAFEEGNEQAVRAGEAMRGVADSISRVTDIMGEISAASREQTTGIEEINIAVTQMDDVTRQNASLVEESAAAAASLKDQADTLTRLVDTFRLRDAGGGLEPSLSRDHALHDLPAPAQAPIAVGWSGYPADRRE